MNKIYPRNMCTIIRKAELIKILGELVYIGLYAGPCLLQCNRYRIMEWALENIPKFYLMSRMFMVFSKRNF